MTFEAKGFKKIIAQGVQVQVANTARVDGPLELGSPVETVTVTAEASLLKTENAEQSTNISGRTFNALPLNFGVTTDPQLAQLRSARARRCPCLIKMRFREQGINGAPGGSFKIYSKART